MPMSAKTWAVYEWLLAHPATDDGEPVDDVEEDDSE